ncbi:Rv3654c family TadE-like protein [Arthrobacter antibioticus]|uniref:Rv3654c family TadE-like protein n=1 Tax=Arthrobacter sp. H35-MC1 TaxID=3046203 RepID=UPI0024BB096B|nr:Rv3654c family TadE-like protein [Arthrobacter sp. H35-MC1]MDJ0317866.1 flp pilus-assembly TadE/G-like family protein [Arthrobacter sp. H35-MC1]
MLSAGERGSGTVLAAGLALTMLILMVLILGLAQAAAAAAKAATAADMAALAAADTYRGLTEGEPCLVAADVAGRHGAILIGCIAAGDFSVQVEVHLATGMGVPLQATGKARAGPPPDSSPPLQP